MGCGPVACVGDFVYFPEVGTMYPLCTGNCMFLNCGRPVCHVGDFIACPGGGVVCTGSVQSIDGGRPVSRIGDDCISPDCGPGVICTGSPQLMCGA